MKLLSQHIQGYLHYCKYQKKLSDHTLKAYQIDLYQFMLFTEKEAEPLSKACIQQYIEALHTRYKPKSVKRKLACLKAMLNHLEFEEEIEHNPFNKLRLQFKEPLALPKSLPLKTIQALFAAAHRALEQPQTETKRNTTVRDIAVLELLFATGLRVSELCSISKANINLQEGYVKVQGKGAKERIVFIANSEVLSALRYYKKKFLKQIDSTGCFFINRLGHQLSEQSVRTMLLKYSRLANIDEHITPHMIRHSFATLMLEEDVDIRYIQSILGHSSISTTQIYTHVAINKQRTIMAQKHPRNKVFI